MASSPAIAATEPAAACASTLAAAANFTARTSRHITRAVSACWNVSHHQSRLPDGLQPVLIAQIAGCVQRALIVGDGHLEPAGLLLQTLQVRLRLLKDQQEPLVVDLMLLLGWLKDAPVPMQRLATRMLCQRLKAGCQLLASRRHTVQRGPG